MFRLTRGSGLVLLAPPEPGGLLVKELPDKTSQTIPGVATIKCTTLSPDGLILKTETIPMDGQAVTMDPKTIE